MCQFHDAFPQSSFGSWNGGPVKSIKVRKAGNVRLTGVAHPLYSACGIVVPSPV
ncbi:hypothetical protein GCM10009839_54330 [Catenulispora yoronensis]|uniref:Uncharacterized protein n=1 Tax=Catenulispora yoronensis TaxID=450799 RepID=A0ABN2UVQ9_9ACTN